MSIRRSRAEVAEIIEQFLDGTGGRWDWDDFCSIRIKDPELDAIRLKCVTLHDDDPHRYHYCGEVGIAVMRGFVDTLRKA